MGSRRRDVTRDSRGQTLQDYAIGIGVFLLAVTFVFTTLGGFLAPSEGEIRLNGAPVTGPGADRSVVFQRHALMPWLNVIDNVAFGSPAAEAAADVGLDVAARYGSELHVVSVVDAFSMGVDVRSHLMTDALEDAAQDAVDSIADRAGDSVAGVETAVGFGRPYGKLRRYIADNDVDLVVMGTHGRTGLERYLLGSVTEKIVRTSPVPVLTVRSADTDED